MLTIHATAFGVFILAVVISMIVYTAYYLNKEIWDYVSYSTFFVNLIECLSMLCLAYIFWQMSSSKREWIEFEEVQAKDVDESFQFQA